jgi:hypothetical protein
MKSNVSTCLEPVLLQTFEIASQMLLNDQLVRVAVRFVEVYLFPTRGYLT